METVKSKIKVFAGLASGSWSMIEGKDELSLWLCHHDLITSPKCHP
jgi:hypothetical protein